MIFKESFPHTLPYFENMADLYLADEQVTVACLLSRLTTSDAQLSAVKKRATELVTYARDNQKSNSGIDAFLAQYSLSSQEGAILMCLAESLLRIPDGATQEKLIRDKLGSAQFELHQGKSDSTFVNFSTWALMFSGKIVSWHETKSLNPVSLMKKLVSKTGEPIIRTASLQGVKLMGKQFVLGETIEEAHKRGQEMEKKGYLYSYDMLGEAAKTAEDAAVYFASYKDALLKIIETEGNKANLASSNGLSIKLSALHPRYEFAQRERVLTELYDIVHQLCVIAAKGNVKLTIDAEEADRLSLSLELIDKISASAELKEWQGLGLAVQAYQKRAPAVLDFLTQLSKRDHRRFMVRLVKGAYWDSEIKWAQEQGLDSYPVFTRKSSTDVSYAYCVQKMLANRDAFYSQFATHNAQTVAWILENADHQDFEFQKLHGMGDEIYDQIVTQGYKCRIYAPVGNHTDLLSYLVRRLLENGANTSFVNRMADKDVTIDQMIEDPILKTAALENLPHPKLRLPSHLYRDRANSRGINIADPAELAPLSRNMVIPESETEGGETRTNPATGEVIGTLTPYTAENVDKMMQTAHKHASEWDKLGGDTRAKLLEAVADAFEDNTAQLLAFLTKEAGKTLKDGIAEVREAVDFCRYYALHARKHFAAPLTMEGPTGELNQLSLHGRGVFVCISPWNFPLAIFTGQIAAALAAGNAVIAKPAAQTPLVAQFAISLFHQAGIPEEILHLAIGGGRTIGEQLIKHPSTAGVAFTGSTDTAFHINQTLAAKRGPIIPFIAETGGQNCMLVDSSALPEQLIQDIIDSSFQSAGQRCSALRVLYLQEDIADKVIKMLTGAMQELNINDPAYLSSDVGPVIDAGSKKILEDHIRFLDDNATLIHRCDIKKVPQEGHFFAPAAYEISSIKLLEKEVFGPVLHIVRYKASELNKVVDEINSTGFGLTFGVHSRISKVASYLREHIHAGNIYVNRNTIGAVVGVQPFGGEGLSGTGPKAGGPYTLFRYACERTYTVDTTAIGGNTSLVTMEE